MAVSIFLLVAGFPFSVCNAQENNVIQYKSLGFRFTIPQNWEGKETEGKYLLTNGRDKGFVTISSYPFDEINGIKTQLEKGIKKEKGFFLAPAEQIKIIGNNRLQGKFSGLINFSPVIVYLILLQGEQQQTVLIISAIEKENYSEKQEIVAKALADGFNFFTPVMPSVVDEYEDLLSGTRLINTEGSDGMNNESDVFNNNEGFDYQEKITIDLCKQGFFSYSDSRAGNGSVTFVSGNTALTGQWDIVKNQKGYAVLRLHFEEGDTEKYTIGYFEGKVYLNGDEFIRSTHSFASNDSICN